MLVQEEQCRFAGALLFVALFLLMPAPLFAETAQVVFDKAPRQTIEAFGSLVGDAAKPPPKGTPLRMLALPADLNAISPKQGDRDLTKFKAAFIDGGFITQSQAAGITQFILMPHGVPGYMLDNNTSPAAGGEHPLIYEFVPKYALLLGDILQLLKEKYGLEFSAVSVAARTQNITPDQWALVVKFLHAICQARQMESTRVAATEWPGDDPGNALRLNAIKKDNEAWNGLGIVLLKASFAAPAVPYFEDFCKADGRRMWLVDQAGATGNRTEADEAVLLVAGLNDGASVLIGRSTTSQPLLSLATAFVSGTVMRHAKTSVAGLSSAAGKRSDGAWVLAVAQSSTKGGVSTLPANLSIKLDECTAIPELACTVHRFGPGGSEAGKIQMVMRQGILSLSLAVESLVIVETAPAHSADNSVKEQGR